MRELADLDLSQLPAIGFLLFVERGRRIGGVKTWRAAEGPRAPKAGEAEQEGRGRGHGGPDDDAGNRSYAERRGWSGRRRSGRDPVQRVDGLHVGLGAVGPHALRDGEAATVVVHGQVAGDG